MLHRRPFAFGALALAALGCEGKLGGADGAGGGDNAAPRFTGKTLDGEYLALADYRTKVVLLNVWATWCKPCRRELPQLQRLHEELGPQGFSVVAVSVDRARARRQVEQLVGELGLTFPVVLDPANASVQAFRVHGYPTNLIIGRSGTILWRRDGMIHPEDAELDTQLTAALAAPT